VGAAHQTPEEPPDTVAFLRWVVDAVEEFRELGLESFDGCFLGPVFLCSCEASGTGADRGGDGCFHERAS